MPSLRKLTSTLYSRWWSERSPERLGAGLTTGRHVEADGHKLMAFHDNGGNLVSVTMLPHHRWGGILIRLAGLSFPSIQHLNRIRKSVST